MIGTNNTMDTFLGDQMSRRKQHKIHLTGKTDFKKQKLEMPIYRCSYSMNILIAPDLPTLLILNSLVDFKM